MKTSISNIFSDPDVLRTPSYNLDESDLKTGEIRSLIKHLTERCMSEEYLGFSPQNLVGLTSRPSIVLASQPGKRLGVFPKKPIIIINPEIISNSQDSYNMSDGCAGVTIQEGNSEDSDTIALFLDNKKRPESITITGMDENGRPFEKTFHGNEAFVLHHEIEHTKGKLMTDGYTGNYILFEYKGKYYLAGKEELQQLEKISNPISFDQMININTGSKNGIDWEKLFIPGKDGKIPINLGLPD